jgi:hypothetical protein
MYFFFQQLSNAGMIERRQISAGTAGMSDHPSKFNPAVWLMADSLGDVPVSDSNWFEGNYDNVFHLFQGTIKPEEAWNLDMKMDDGKPGTGKMRATEDSTWGCYDPQGTIDTQPRATLVTYDLDSTSGTCGLIAFNLR